MSATRRSTVALGALSLLALVSDAHDISAHGEGLSGRLIVGYQGWFGCPGDFEDNKVWYHWFTNGALTANVDWLTVDMLPTTRNLRAEDLCDTGLPRMDGHGTIKLFSSQNQAVVSAHFRMMQDHQIDTVALQRFLVSLADPVSRRRTDHVLDNVRVAAESTKRSFYISYDISGADPKTVIEDLRKDWQYLANQKKVTSSASYLRDHGKPVVELWGFGFPDRPGTPNEARALIEDLKSGKHGLTAATVIGGVPSNWRVQSVDSSSGADWAATYRSFNVISPWTVGRFVDKRSAQTFTNDFVIPDMAETRRLGIEYLPVMFPGFSWYNLSRQRDHSAVWKPIARDCGKFLSQQIANLMDARANVLFLAMFDETDEGTAIFPTVAVSDELPKGARMSYLNEEGCSLPEDWYLSVAGKAAADLRNSAPLQRTHSRRLEQRK